MGLIEKNMAKMKKWVDDSSPFSDTNLHESADFRKHWWSIFSSWSPMVVLAILLILAGIITNMMSYLTISIICGVFGFILLMIKGFYEMR